MTAPQMDDVFKELSVIADRDEEKQSKGYDGVQKTPGRKPTAGEVRKTSFDFPIEVYDELREMSFERRCSMKDVLVELIMEARNA